MDTMETPKVFISSMNKPLCVLQIGAAFVGAQQKIEYEIHKCVKKHGGTSYILYADGVSKDNNILCFETKIQKFYRRFVRKIGFKSPLFARGATKNLIKYIRRINPDIVHLHVLHHGYVDYIMLFEYLIKSKIPIVYTVHDMWAFTGGCYYYTKDNCMGFQTGCRGCFADQKRLDNRTNKTAHYFNLKKDLFSRSFDLRFVAVSQWVADEMKKSFLAQYPITVIENGVDILPLYMSSNSAYQMKKNKFVLLGVAAAWDERKGIDRIFEMARILGDRFRFDLVGNTSETIMAQAPPNVRFLGYVHDKATLLQLYANSDLHISASFEETFGMTFIEAAFMGTRSIGYASTAVLSTLQGIGGIAVSKLDVYSMADAIQKVIMSENLKLSADEIQRVVARYDSIIMAQKYCDIYRSILEKGE